MKKYLLSLLLVAALVASFIVPTLGDGEAEDFFPEGFSLYVTNAEGTILNGNSGQLKGFIFDECLYIKTTCSIHGATVNDKTDGSEMLEVKGIDGSTIDGIESIEYKDKTVTDWTDAFGLTINKYNDFTQKSSINRFYKFSFKESALKEGISFSLLWKAITPRRSYESYLRNVYISKDDEGTINALTYFIRPEPTSTTTEEITTTTEEAMTTTVVPTSTVAPTNYKKAKTPGKAKIKKVWKKKKSAKKLKIKLAKVKNAKGYQICVYKNKKNAKKHIKAIVTKYTTKVKYTIKSKKLKKKKKLFVGARAYNVSSNGSKVFGAWAKIKKVKIK